MKKRVLSALLVLCMACSMVSTVWATETNATSGAPEPASQTLNLDNEQPGGESGADSTGAPSDSIDSTSASSDSTSSGSSSAASDTASDAMSDVTSGEGDESAASSDSTAASDSTSSSSSASSDSSDSDADDPNAASSDVTGDESSTGTEEESDLVTEQPSAGSESVPSQHNRAPAAPQADTRATSNTFHITWGEYFDVTVHYVDQYGAPINYDFGCQDQTLTNEKRLTFSNFAAAGKIETATGTYTYDAAHYNGYNGDTISSVSASSESDWGVFVGDYYHYYYTFSNNQRLTYTDGGRNPTKNTQTADVYLVYNFEEFPPEELPEGALSIEDSVARDGVFTAVFEEGTLQDGDTVTYRWEVSRTGVQNTWQTVESQKVTGENFNWRPDVDPEKINVAFDSLLRNVTEDQRYYYRVTATVTHADGTIDEYKAQQRVPYYIQLQNGSFETPDITTFNNQMPNGTAGLIWYTTGPGSINGKNNQDIEIILEGFNDTQRNYGVNVASDGEQFAELNCEAYGALYQDVMTVPGTTLNWRFDHLARQLDDQSYRAEDTMAMVIMPADQADEVAQELQEAATTYRNNPVQAIQEIKNILNGLEGRPGCYVYEATDGTYNAEKDWQTHKSTADTAYTVPEDQYLTRFFFVSVDAAYDHRNNADKTKYGTVGNLIDNVWFSTHAQPPANDEAQLTVAKTVTGLSEKEMEDYSVTLQIGEPGANTQTVTLNNFEPGIGGSYTASKTLNYTVQANTGSKTVTVSETQPQVSGYTVDTSYTVTGAVAQTGTGTQTEQFTIPARENATVTFTNTYTPKIPPTTTLTLKKTFAGLSNEEVYYLLFGQSEATEGEAYWDANFSFDVNYCDLKHTDNDGGLKYMAYGTNIPDAVVVPGTSTKVQNGGALKVYAARLLTKPASAEQLGDARAATVTPASLTQNSTTGDWTFETTITVPTCTNANNSITVYEQHGEVPGYAKLGTASTRYTVSLNGATEGQDGYWTGNGKFVCESGKQLEDMKGENDAYWIDGEGEGDQNVRFARLAVTAPTTISFTNNYTGKLDVTKAIGVENEYTDAEAETYTLTLEPAHPTKLDLKSDDGAQHGLSGKRVHYYTTDSSKTTELTIDQNGKITIPNVPVNTDIHFIDLPAIQWKVGEDTSSATVTGYQLGQSVTDENNDVVEDAAHWNGYVTGNEIGSTATNDGIVSVDSSLGSTAVAKATVTNEYTRQMQTLTVKKIVSGGMGSNTDDFNFTITLVDTTKGSEQGYQPYVFTAVPDGLTQKTDESDNKISGSYEFTLSGGEKIEIQLPYGVQATVTEDLDSTSGYKVASRKYNSNDQTGELPTFTNVANQEVTIGVYNEFIEFQNTREAVAPTGLESNHTTPYVLMITAAGMAGLALIGGIVARRIRRRRQE